MSAAVSLRHDPIVSDCACGQSWTASQWATLPLEGVLDDEWVVREYRSCRSCPSSHTILLGPSPSLRIQPDNELRWNIDYAQEQKAEFERTKRWAMAEAVDRELVILCAEADARGLE